MVPKEKQYPEYLGHLGDTSDSDSEHPAEKETDLDTAGLNQRQITQLMKQKQGKIEFQKMNKNYKTI